MFVPNYLILEQGTCFITYWFSCFVSQNPESAPTSRTKQIGTPAYMAPEMEDGTYDFKCDIYSFALVYCLLFYIILLFRLSGQFFKYLNINKNPSGKLLNQDKVKIIEECIDSALFSIVSSIGNVCKGANEQDFNFLYHHQKFLLVVLIFFISSQTKMLIT